MIKFLKGPMESMMGVEIYPIISFLIFFTFFVGVLWYVYKKDKTYLAEASALPLETDNEENSQP